MSGKRPQLLVNGEIYHVFNRSLLHEEIFNCQRFIDHVLGLLEYYRYPQALRYSYYKRLPITLKNDYLKSMAKTPLQSEVYAYAIMPNHFHLLVKQLTDNGIRSFVGNFQNSYAKYFNLLRKRDGPVFQGPFKAKRLSTDEEFLHVGRYIHLNPVTSLLVKMEDLGKYSGTSYPTYVSEEENRIINNRFILGLVGSRKKYQRFVENQEEYQKKLHLIKHLVLE